MATELGRLREENADLKKRAEEGRGVEDRLKKAEKRADGLEKEVSTANGDRGKREADGQMEDMISERVLAKQNELNAEYDERLRNYDERYVAASSLSPLSGRDVADCSGRKTFSVKSRCTRPNCATCTPRQRRPKPVCSTPVTGRNRMSTRASRS